MKTAMMAALVTVSALMASGPAHTQEPQQSVDLTGDWIGYAIAGDGTQLDFRMSLVRTEEGLTGTLRDVDGAMPEILLRNIVVVGTRLTCELDFPTETGADLIEVTLEYRNDTLSGSYVDPTGDSDRVFFRRVPHRS